MINQSEKEDIKRRFFEVANEKDLDDLYEHFFQETKKYWSDLPLSEDQMRRMYDDHRLLMRGIVK